MRRAALALLLVGAAAGCGGTHSGVRISRIAISTTPTTVARNGFLGVFDRPSSARRHAAVLLFGGSEGGLSTGGIAYRFAAHGYPALAIGYFRGKGLPKLLVHIKLEYFVRALRWLDARPEVDPKRIVVLGISRGSEAAQLLGATFRSSCAQSSRPCRATRRAGPAGSFAASRSRRRFRA